MKKIGKYTRTIIGTLVGATFLAAVAAAIASRGDQPLELWHTVRL